MVRVTKEALIEMINDAMDATIPLDDPKQIINVNSVVDPVACETNPENEDFVPQNKQELNIAVQSLVSMVGDYDAPDAFRAVKSALDTLKKDDGRTMDTRVEEALRLQIRKILKEELGTSGVEEPWRKAQVKQGEEQSFEEIASALGMSVSGAKQLIDKAHARFDALIDMITDDEDEFEIFVLEGVRDYINFLKSSGELTDADIRLLKDHPEMVAELDGFRDFIHKKVKNLVDDHSDESDVAVPQAAKTAATPASASDQSDPEYQEYLQLHAMFGEKAPGNAGAPPANSDGKAYKVYKTPKGPVVRFKTKLYKAPAGTKFNPNDRPYVAPSADGNKITVKNPEDGHTQEWDFDLEEAFDAGASAVLPPPVDPTQDPKYARYIELQKKFGPVAAQKKTRAPKAAPAATGETPAEPTAPSEKSYKVYPVKGGGRVVRYKKKLYRAPEGTKFNPNDRPAVSLNGDKLRVKNQDGHTQEWEPVEEAEIHDSNACGKTVGKTNDGKQINCSMKKGHQGACEVG